MATEHKGGHILHADLQLFGDEGAEACRIEHPGHADDPFPVETGMTKGRLGHGVERIRDDNENRLGRLRDHLLDHIGHDLRVGVQQIVAAHAGLARDARGNDHDVGVGRGGVVVRAGHMDVALLDGHGFQQIQSLALRHAFHHVDQHHIGQFLGCNPVCCRGAHVAGTYYANFLSHLFSPRKFKFQTFSFFTYCQ